MFSSFSSSYSYVSDGKNEKIEKHNRIKNNKNDIGFGSQELRNKEKKMEKKNFYKIFNDKALYGTTDNDNQYKVQERKNNKKIKGYNVKRDRYDDLFVKKKEKNALVKKKSIFSIFDEDFFK